MRSVCFFFQAEDGIRDYKVTGVQTCALPISEIEADIVAHETGISPATARSLVSLARSTRELRHRGLDEGASTRMLIYAGLLMRDGVSVHDSCDMTITSALTDDPDTAAALRQLVEAEFGA